MTPSSWTTVAIEDLLDPLEDGRLIHQGWSPQCESVPAGEEEWGVLKTTAIQEASFDASHNKRLPGLLEPKPGIEVRDGDLLLTCAGPRARCGVACRVVTTRPRLMISGKMYRFRADERVVLSRYLELHLTSPSGQAQIETMKTGISDSGLNLTHARFRCLQVPLAPLPEQRRIIEELERRLSHIDAAVSGLSSARRRLATARIAVLASALLGDGPAGSWSSSRLDAVAEVRLGRQRSPKNHSGGNMRPYLRAANVGWSGLKLDDVKEMNFTDAELAVHRLEKGDIVLSEASGSPGEVGKPALWRGEIEDCCSQNTLIRVRCGDTVTPEFVLLRLRLEALLGTWASSAGGLARGVGIHHLGASRLAGWTVSFPLALDQQRALVAQVDRRLSLIDAAERALDVSLAKAAQLRRSLFAAAFSARLVPQDPDDEPASVLFGRIAATRALAAPTKPTRRTKKDVPA